MLSTLTKAQRQGRLGLQNCIVTWLDCLAGTTGASVPNALLRIMLSTVTEAQGQIETRLLPSRFALVNSSDPAFVVLDTMNTTNTSAIPGNAFTLPALPYAFPDLVRSDLKYICSMMEMALVGAFKFACGRPFCCDLQLL